MSEDADPIAYSALPSGVPLLDTAGNEFGAVDRVLEIPDEDLFDGIVVRTAAGIRFVDADQVVEITTRYVRCSITPSEAEQLPEPAAGPVFVADAQKDVGSTLWNRLGRMFGHGRWKQQR